MRHCWILTAALCLGLASCIGTKSLIIRTDPAGADLAINGVPLKDKSPVKLQISQRKDLGIVASKPGYESAARTINTRTNWWLALLWTKNDPKAQYIEEDEVTLTLQKIPSAAGYRHSALPPYTGGGGFTTPSQGASAAKPPELRPMPAELEG